MNLVIREAVSAEINQMKEMMTRLAEFELPPKRTPEMFYEGDYALVDAWAAGKADHCFAHVAVLDGELVGVTVVTMGEELFDHSPSAHLEIAAVTPGVDGLGIGRKLIANAEQEARKRGAGSMSLHVIRNNYRARHVYEKIGYEEEMIRCIKHFE